MLLSEQEQNEQMDNEDSPVVKNASSSQQPMELEPQPSRSSWSHVPTQSTAASNATTGSGSMSVHATPVNKIKVESTVTSAKGKGLSSFVVRTSTAEKCAFDEQVEKMIYATNSPFRLVEHPEFQKLLSMMRPGYRPPSRKEIADKFLPVVFQKEMDQCKEVLMDATVSMALDGWSNVHNEPIVCVTVTTEEGKIYLTDTVDTSGKPHTAEYLEELAVSSVRKTESDFGCRVRSIVTDNAANVAKMRRNLEQREDIDVITYGCSAHLLNLLAHDMEISNVKEHIVYVMKYFRNNHFALAEYRKEGGHSLVLPQETRWNTMCDSLKSYISNWSIMMKICETHRQVLDSVVHQKVTNVGLKRSAEDLLSRLEPIAEALDRVQRDGSSIADAVAAWKLLEEKLPCLDDRVLKQKFKARYDQAITPAHTLAYLLHPQYEGSSLSSKERDEALVYANTKYAHLVPTVMKFQGHSKPFLDFHFSPDVISSMSAADWWRSHKQVLTPDPEVLQSILQLLTSVASSAGVERVFSSFGLVQSKLRNQLGTDKASKLVFLYKFLNP